MAVLTKPAAGNSSLFSFQESEIPAGTYVAQCVDIKDVFGVERKKFQSEETEICDMTQFLFQLTDEAGNQHKIASRKFKISAHEKSALFGFLKSWLNKDPSIGWDYMELKGQAALLTIGTEIANNGNEYCRINGISPVPAAMRKPPQRPAQQSPGPKRPAPMQQPSYHEDNPFD